VLYIFYAASALLMIYLLQAVYKRIRSITQTLSIVLTYVDNSRNIKKCNAILNTLLISLVLFFSAMLFPFAMFAFNLNIWTNAIPLLLVLFTFYYLRRLAALIDSNSSYVPQGIVGVSFAKF
jgi:hypothetical protein